MLVSSVLRPQTDMWSQQWRTRLPGEIWSTALLLVGRRGLQHRARGRAGVVGVGLPVSRVEDVRLVADPAAGDAQLHPRLPDHRDGWSHRSDPGPVARMVRARRLVPTRRIARRRDHHVQPRPVSVRVPARPRRASRPGVWRLPHGTVARCRTRRIDAASRAPARSPGDRGGCRRGDDGNAHRLRDRAVLRRRHRVGRRLPDLARNVRPRRGQRTRARRPRVRRARHRARTCRPRAGAVRPVRWRGQRNGSEPIDRGDRRQRRRPRARS